MTPEIINFHSDSPNSSTKDLALFLKLLFVDDSLVFFSARSNVLLCGAEVNPQNCLEGDLDSLGPTAILFMAHLVLGFGTSMHFTLGFSYIDDNARKNKSPVYIGNRT